MNKSISFKYFKSITNNSIDLSTIRIYFNNFSPIIRIPIPIVIFYYFFHMHPFG